MDGGSRVSTTPLVQPQRSSHIIMGDIMLLEEVDIESAEKSEGDYSEACVRVLPLPNKSW